MTHPHVRTALAALCIAAVLATGCGFKVAHEMPLEASFGPIQDEHAVRTPFKAWTVKPYLLAGLIPWNMTSAGTTEDCIEVMPERRVERLEIQTLFSPLDALLRFLPYVSYVLALRTISVNGVYVDVPAAPPEAIAIRPTASDLIVAPAVPVSHDAEPMLVPANQDFD